jgi:hypothetical protein
MMARVLTLLREFFRDIRPLLEMGIGARLIPLSQVDQYLGLAGQIRNGAGFDFFGRS